MNGDSSARIRVVTVGGGTGSSILLSGLNEYADRLDISAIVTTFDDGGSSGKLRREFDIPALGDIRRCIAALLPNVRDRSYLRGKFEFRFAIAKRFQGDAFGNLLLLAAVQRFGGFSVGVEGLASELRTNGRVIPVSEELSTLCAVAKNGTVIRGETEIDAQAGAHHAIDRVYLDPPVSANPSAVRAIESADVIILGPGDLFTSVVPNLLPTGVAEAIQQSHAQVVQVCNLKARPNQANVLRSSDFPKVINQYASIDMPQNVDNRIVDAIVVNAHSDDANASADAIEIDDELINLVSQVIVEDIADPENPNRHDPDKLARALMGYLAGSAVHD